jgi:hypothetical protein
MAHLMFGNASAAQNFTIDSLENVFNSEFKSFLSGQAFDHFLSEDFDRSVSFGQDISNAIYNWSTTDGGDKAYLNVFPSSYVPPVGPGLWVPQPGTAPRPWRRCWAIVGPTVGGTGAGRAAWRA